MLKSDGLKFDFRWQENLCLFGQIRLQEKTYSGLLTFRCDRSEEVFRLAR
jgi:hypothetical protein